MTDTLLFLHLLSAAALFAGIVVLFAVVLGAQLERGIVRLFVVVWQVGLMGLLVFGLLLAIDIDGYQPWDPWILIAIVLWLAAGGVGDRVSAAFRDPGGGEGAIPAGTATALWVHCAIVVLLLADMIWKPWA